MHQVKLIVGVTLAMLAFAGNSLLCRAALKGGAMDAASFTSVRLVSGALVLGLLLGLKNRRENPGQSLSRLPGDGLSALALFVYAAGFSFAYLSMSAATGALLLFGAVQVTMIAYGLYRGERLRSRQWMGFLLAIAGLIVLLLPGLATPGWGASICMVTAGVAWGVYSLLGARKTGASGPSPMTVTAGNFVRTVPLALVLMLGGITLADQHWSVQGVMLAIASGAITSGLGYAIWYRVLPHLQATHAATVQLCVPFLATVGGIVLLGEPTTWAVLATGFAILGGIALVVWGKSTVKPG